MSMINTIRRADRVMMLTDGIGLNSDDATVASIGTKPLPFPLLNAVVGVRGNAMASIIVLCGLSDAFKTYDEMKAAMIEYVRGAAKTSSVLKVTQGKDCFDCDVIVAGWSEKTGPDSYLLRTIENTPTPAWDILDTGNVLLTPSNDAIFVEMADELAGPRASFILSDAALVRCAEKQRAYQEPIGPNQIMSSMVGGFLQLTTVTEREISTRIIHRWDDRVGERIASDGRAAA